MSKVLSIFGGVIGVVVAATPVLAFEVPPTPSGFVNDFANVLSIDVKNQIEQDLVRFAASTTNEVTVVTVPDMGNDYIEHYALSVAEKWGVGNEKKDNGVLLLLSIAERAIRIEVGYGLEGALPDSVASRIIQDEMVLRLKEENYDTAVLAGVAAIQDATKGEYKTEEQPWDAKRIENALFFVFMFGVLALQWLGAVLGRTKEWWLGGVIGAVIGVVISTYFEWWIVGGGVLTAGLIAFGLFFDYVVSSTMHHAQKYGVEPPWWAGGHSGGFGGGGFGGFGGGSFGGGGASGRW